MHTRSAFTFDGFEFTFASIIAGLTAAMVTGPNLVHTVATISAGIEGTVIDVLVTINALDKKEIGFGIPKA